MNQSSLIINGVPWYLPDTNFRRCAENIDSYKVYEGHISKITFMPIRDRWVNTKMLITTCQTRQFFNVLTISIIFKRCRRHQIWKQSYPLENLIQQIDPNPHSISSNLMDVKGIRVQCPSNFAVPVWDIMVMLKLRHQKPQTYSHFIRDTYKKRHQRINVI